MVKSAENQMRSTLELLPVMTQNRSVLQPIKHLFSHALSIYTVYVFNFENVVISHV